MFTSGRPHAVADLVRANKGSGDVTVIVLNENPTVSSIATACAVSRACKEKHVCVCVCVCNCLSVCLFVFVCLYLLYVCVYIPDTFSELSSHVYMSMFMYMCIYVQSRPITSRSPPRLM